METVCSGERCPRRWVCRRADPVTGPAAVADFRKTEACWEVNNFPMFERNDRSAEDLVRMEIGVIASQMDLLNSLEMSRVFIAEEVQDGKP